MERDYMLAEQATTPPLRTMPMIRKARRPRRPVFRVSNEYDVQTEAYELNGMDSFMSRKDDAKNKYGNDDIIDDILSEYHSGALFSDFDYDDADEDHVEEIHEEYAPEIDSRFNLGGQRRRDTISYAGREADLSADEDYVPHSGSSDSPRSWTPAEDAADDVSDDDVKEYVPRRKKSEPVFDKKQKKSRAKKEKQSRKAKSGYQPKYIYEEEDEEETFAAGFRDVTGELSGYAEAADYAEGSYKDPAGEESDDSYTAPSFSEYVASVFASFFLRLKGTARGNSAATMEDDTEDLGTELSPMAASKYYGSYVHSTKLRLNIALGLLAFMLYLSVGLPVPGMLAYLPVTASMCMAIQLTIMLLALDIVTNGILKMARLQIGADSLAVIACVVTTVDAATVALAGDGATHLPLCAISSASLVGVMFSSLLSVRALRKALRVPAIAKRTYSIVGENDVKGRDITLLKTSRPATGFVRRSEEAAPDETMFIKLAPIMLLAAILLTLIVSAVTRNFYEVVYIFSAVLSPAVPFTALICFALPYYLGSKKIFSSGAAIAGWSGLCDVGQSSNLIVTDRDLFPEGSISIESIRIFADEDAQKVISYAGTMIIASGCSMAKAFSDEMEQNGCTIQPMEGFEYLSGGGMKGIISGHVVLCGSSDLMRLMNVRIPFRLVDKTTVLLAIDGILYGIFAMNYEPQPQVRKALVELIRSNRHPIFALRDFNITPEMLKTTFDIATDGYDFPPYVERFKITETQPSENSKIAAVVCREGLAPVTTMADTGKSMYTATRLNLLIAVLSAVLGMLAIFIKMLSTGSISLGFILLYMILTAIPVIIVSLIKF